MRWRQQGNRWCEDVEAKNPWISVAVDNNVTVSVYMLLAMYCTFGWMFYRYCF